MTPTLNRLREERSQYLQYQKTERELEHLNRQHVAFKVPSSMSSLFPFEKEKLIC